MWLDPYSLDDYIHYKEDTLLQESERERLLRHIRELQGSFGTWRRIWNCITRLLMNILQRWWIHSQEIPSKEQDALPGASVNIQKPNAV